VSEPGTVSGKDWLKVGQRISLCALAATLPFAYESLNITSLLVILFSVISLISMVGFSEVSDWKSRRGMMVLFASSFLVCLPGYFWSTNTDQAAFELEKKLSLLVLPIFFGCAVRLTDEEVKKILACFVVGCVVALMICVVRGSLLWRETGDSSHFFYHALSQGVGMHAAYLSLYLLLSLVIVFNLFPGERFLQISRSKRILVILCVLWLLLGILLLASRMQQLILLMGMMGYVAYRLSGTYGWGISMVAGAGAMIVVLVALLAIPVNRERFKQAINYGNNYSISSQWGEMQMRPLMWTCAWQTIQANPWIGVGLGDGQDVLQACYEERKFGTLTYLPDARYNAHNQAMETTIQLGVVGLLVLVISVAAPVVAALRDRNYLYLLFMLIFFLSCLTESMLQRQSGIVFFAFFNSLLFWNRLPGAEPAVTAIRREP